MNPAYLVIIFFLFIWIFSENRKKTALTMRVIKNKRLKGAKKMHELLEKYLGQECIVYTMSNQQVAGTIDKIQDGWLSLTDEGGNGEALNLDYITRVRPVPRKKNGKKKSVILD